MRKKIFILLLCFPIMMFGQRKKELKIRIEQKNDSLYMYENMTNSLDRKIKRLEKDISEMRNESSRLQKQNQEQSDEIEKNQERKQ